MNWAKRNKCNICNTSKPGTEGGPRYATAANFEPLKVTPKTLFSTENSILSAKGGEISILSNSLTSAPSALQTGRATS